MSMFRALAAATIAAGILAAAAEPAHALPDLTVEVEDLAVIHADVDQADVDEGCAAGTDNRRLIDFSLRTRNVGTTDLILGNPGCPNCTLNPGAPCSNPLFVCGTAHGHAHFESFARTELVDTNNMIVATSHKYGFCLLDLECDDPTYSCSYQGISAGCSDVYSSGLPCQYVDITDAEVPDGFYTLRVIIDPDNTIVESNEANNTISVPIQIGSTPPICPEYASTDVPVDIEDQSTVTSSLVLPDIGDITGLRIRLDGEHSFIGDVTARVISPSSTDVTLMSGICDGNDDFNLYLGDEAAGAISCPPTNPDTLQDPEEPLSAFLGEPAEGTWTLEIEDTAGSDVGTLQGWSLEVCTICGNGQLDPGEACDDGNVDDGDCCSGDCLSVVPDGTPCTNANECMVGGTCDDGSCEGGDLIVCDPCLVCDPEAGCVVPTVIYPCQDAAPGKSTILVRDGASPQTDAVTWKWKSETPVELDEFGAPQLSTELSLCVYDADGLVLSTTAVPGTDCGTGACWQMKPGSAAYSDHDGLLSGITSIRVKEGTHGKIVLKGGGENLDVSPLFLNLPVTVRMRRNDGTPCWEAEFDSSALNSGALFKARSNR